MTALENALISVLHFFNTSSYYSYYNYSDKFDLLAAYYAYVSQNQYSTIIVACSRFIAVYSGWPSCSE